MQTHKLKTLPDFFQASWECKKQFEFRVNDRNFKVNDYVVLQEYDGENYTGREIEGVITYILDLQFFIGNRGYVCFNFDVKKRQCPTSNSKYL